MAATTIVLTLALSAGTVGWPGGAPLAGHSAFQPGGRILPDGPGYGWGFANGNPDGYGWFDFGDQLPLGANRTAEYFFPRYLAIPATQSFLPTYYNPYLTRGQRYLPYSGDGGDHPAGGRPLASAEMPRNPYRESLGNGPRVQIPAFTGRVEAPAVNTGASGLTP